MAVSQLAMWLYRVDMCGAGCVTAAWVGCGCDWVGYDQWCDVWLALNRFGIGVSRGPPCDRLALVLQSALASPSGVSIYIVVSIHC